MTRRRRLGPAPRRRSARDRRGMTLVEVLIAMSILAIVLVGVAQYFAGFARDISHDALRATASDLVVTRLEAVKGVTRYDGIEGFARTEAAIPGYAGFTRTTVVQRVTSAQTDHRVVTVVVTHPAMPDTVRKTTMIARF